MYSPLRRPLIVVLGVMTLVLLSMDVDAQTTTQPAPASPATAQTTSPAQTTDDEDDDDPSVLDVAEPDFVVVNLPTNLRLPRFKSNFRLTHRFVGNLRTGTFGDNASSLFGLDEGAIIGFEYRINLMRNLQAAAFRTNFDKTVLLYAKYDGIRQRGAMPVSISGIVSIEGTNNFQEKFAPGVGVVLSRKVGTRLALYATPFVIDNTNASLAPIDHGHDHGGEVEEHEHEAEEPAHERRSTIFVGFGARARLTPTLYAVGEVTPRMDGYAPDEIEYGFGIEKRVGGHAFALTFTNTLGTTFAQMARGGTANSLYLGFNLGRKFF